MGGRDVRLIMQRRDIQVNGPSDYYLQYVPKQKEYRIHVIDDEVVKISEKRLNDEGEYDQLVWNYDTGWTFHHPRDTHASVYMAMAAVNALDLDFGAVDMIIGEDENPYILEVNTCPGLDEPSLDIYEEKFRELIEL